jgi:NADPH:quinone reductase-like Zn-dependent oxidoreductase
MNRIGGLRTPKRTILGADVAGRVEAVGSGVTQFQPGDEVFGDLSGCGWGGFAEYVCARPSALALKPAGLSFDEAAAVPQAGVLALQGLRDKGRLQAGQRVLINGAGGGVGTFAVQLAKARGAEVTGVDSAVKLDLVRALGADYVIDYAQADFTEGDARYDLILDVVGLHSMFDIKRVLNSTGRYVMVGGRTPRILQSLVIGPAVAAVGRQHMGLLVHRPSAKDLVALGRLLETGTVRSVIDRRYPLHEVAEALWYFGTGAVLGKVVITV